MKKKSLMDIIQKSFRGAIFSALTISSIKLASAQSPSRITETETFNGTITKSHTEDYPEKWNIGAQSLEASDFEGISGETKSHINDKLYNFKTTNLNLEVEIDKSEWGSDFDHTGIIFSGDHIGGTYYVFSVNTKFNKYWITRRSPGLNHTYKHGFFNFMVDGKNTLKVTYNATGYHFSIRNSIYGENEITVNEAKNLPLLEGYPGFFLYDSMGQNDPPFTSTAYFDNFTAEFDEQQGGGGGSIKTSNELIPHKPEIFLRGDPNRDGIVNISDAITTLNYLFQKPDFPPCLDAMDMNDDGNTDISDVVRTLLYSFSPIRDYKIIMPPHIGGPGMDLSYDRLNCPEI